ncbi:MAG: hypothetical protein IE933_09245 [Sphingomonadales bacterium]|nr:hypothetical protein [Sphingomonadales bacterium]MBD3772875.1 hypothetical protein [Paracoccaceae bacterium]
MAKGKPGELTLVIGGLALVSAAVIPVTTADVTARMDRLRDEGHVALATVKSARSEDRERVDYRGKPRPGADHYYLDLEFDRASPATHRDWMAGKPLAQSATPVLSRYELDVSRAIYAAHGPGSRIAISFIPGRFSFDKDSLQASQMVESQGSGEFRSGAYTAALLCGLLGLWLVRRGWRRRFGGDGR